MDVIHAGGRRPPAPPCWWGTLPPATPPLPACSSACWSWTCRSKRPSLPPCHTMAPVVRKYSYSAAWTLLGNAPLCRGCGVPPGERLEIPWPAQPAWVPPRPLLTGVTWQDLVVRCRSLRETLTSLHELSDFTRQVGAAVGK